MPNDHPSSSEAVKALKELLADPFYVCALLFERTGAAAIEIHSGDREPGTYCRRKPEYQEAAAKLDFLDGRVLFNTALFYSKYRDIQLTVARVNPASPAFAPDIGSSIDNAGEATIQGLEVELITRPWDTIVLRGSVGITDAEYDEFTDQTWDINPGTGLVENIRGFHDTVLGGGALPLAILERRVDDWIAAERAR